MGIPVLVGSGARPWGAEVVNVSVLLPGAEMHVLAEVEMQVRLPSRKYQFGVADATAKMAS